MSARPLTVGLQIFSSGDQGVDWSIITARHPHDLRPLLIGFLLSSAVRAELHARGIR